MKLRKRWARAIHLPPLELRRSDQIPVDDMSQGHRWALVPGLHLTSAHASSLRRARAQAAALTGVEGSLISNEEAVWQSRHVQPAARREPRLRRRDDAPARGFTRR